MTRRSPFPLGLSLALVALAAACGCDSRATVLQLATQDSGSDTDGGAPPDASGGPSAPLVCDEARAGEIAFVAHQSPGFHSAYLPHGHRLLVVDGACDFVAFVALASGAVPGELRTGSLSASEVHDINDEVLTAPWSALAGMRNFGAGADAWTFTFMRGEHTLRCYEHCPGDDAAPVVLAAAEWTDRLFTRGTPLEGGSVDAHVARRDVAPMGADVPLWEGGTALSPAGLVGVIGVDDTGDVAALRAMRAAPAVSGGTLPIMLREGDQLLGVGVADRLPWELTLRDDHPSGWL